MSISEGFKCVYFSHVCVWVQRHVIVLFLIENWGSYWERRVYWTYFDGYMESAWSCLAWCNMVIKFQFNMVIVIHVKFC